MKIGNPSGLYWLWLLAGLILFYAWSFRKRQSILRRFADKKILDNLLSSFDLRKSRLKKAFLFTGFTLLILAVVRPQWGFHWQEVRRRGIDILIAIDTSKSMLVEDVKPNRLERSKLAVKDLVSKLKGDKTGLIAFSGTAFLQCPLTLDYNGFLLTLDDLSINTIPLGSTSISSAIKEAMKIYKDEEQADKVLVIITDGEDHQGNPVQEAKLAKKEGIKIFCIGIGTEEGDLIPVKDEHGRMAYLKDKNGHIVKSRIDENTLKKIALETGGIYVRATGLEFGLDRIYEERLSKLEKQDFESRMKRVYDERFQIPLIMAIIFFIMEPLISERKKKQ